MFLFCSTAGFVCMVPNKPALSPLSNALKIMQFHSVSCIFKCTEK